MAPVPARDRRYHRFRPGGTPRSRARAHLRQLQGRSSRPGRPAGPIGRNIAMKRYGSVIGLRPEKLDEYKKPHAAVWPDVLKMIKACHIQNYSIYLRRLDDGRHY